jgi:hypothetical protein
MPAVPRCQPHLDQLDANDLHFLRKVVRGWMRHQRRRIASAKPTETYDDYVAACRARIAYARTVVAKLGGDPELFMEPELDGVPTGGGVIVSDGLHDP